MEDVCERSERVPTILWPYRRNRMLMPLVHHHPIVLPRKGRRAQPRRLMMMIYTWNEDVWLAFKLRWFSGKLHLPYALCNNIRARRSSAESVFKHSQYKVATNTFLSKAKCFCEFKLRHFQRHPLGNRNLDQSLLEMSHPSLLSPLGRKISVSVMKKVFSSKRVHVLNDIICDMNITITVMNMSIVVI